MNGSGEQEGRRAIRRTAFTPVDAGDDDAAARRWDTLRGHIQAGKAWEAVAALTELADDRGTFPALHPVVGGIAHWFWDPAERYHQGPLAPVLDAILRLCPPLLRPLCGRARTLLQGEQGPRPAPDLALRAAMVLIRGVARLDDPPLPAPDVHACLDHALKTFREHPGQEPLWRGLVVEALIGEAVAQDSATAGAGKALCDCLLLQWHGLPPGTHLWFAAAAPLVLAGHTPVAERVAAFADDAAQEWHAEDAWRCEPLWPLLLHTPFATRLKAETLRRLRPLAGRWWYRLLIDLYLVDLYDDDIAAGAVEAFLRKGPDEPGEGTGPWPFQCAGDYLLSRGRIDDCVRLLERMSAQPAMHWEHPGFSAWFAAWFPDSPDWPASPASVEAMAGWLRKRITHTRLPHSTG